MPKQEQPKWSDRSPEERAAIELNRSLATHNNPFTGKNQAQRNRLHNGFNAMSSKWRKLGGA